MLETYTAYTPNTIWEAYSPIEPRPSSYKKNKRDVRPDFCGWSALAPISMFIENVLGFHEINAFKNQVVWDLNLEYKGKQGIKNLQFGTNITDILFENNTIAVSTNKAYSLQVNGEWKNMQSGNNIIKL